MVNLADIDREQVSIKLEVGLRFVCFVDQLNSRHTTQINVLLKNQQNENVDDPCYIIQSFEYKNPFEYRQVFDESSFRRTVQCRFKDLEFVGNDKVRKVIMVERPRAESSDRSRDYLKGIFVQTTANRLFFQQADAESKVNAAPAIDISEFNEQPCLNSESRRVGHVSHLEPSFLLEENGSVKLEMQRGVKNQIIYARREEDGHQDTIFEARVVAKERGILKIQIEQIKTPTSMQGNINALELVRPTLGSENQDQESWEENKDSVDKISIIDESCKLFIIDLKENVVVKEQDLTQLPGLNYALQQHFKQYESLRMYASDRCITFLGTTYNYETGNSWDFNYNCERIQKEQLDYQLSESLPFSN